jgi:hypothetical protein
MLVSHYTRLERLAGDKYSIHKFKSVLMMVSGLCVLLSISYFLVLMIKGNLVILIGATF